jgi:cytochrome bd ubiquinol oxidase subunit I
LPRVSRWNFSSGLTGPATAHFVGDIFDIPLAIEGIYAFFLESGFLALLLFGWHKIGPRMHFFSTCMVALGSLFSAIWILVAELVDANARWLSSCP